MFIKTMSNSSINTDQVLELTTMQRKDKYLLLAKLMNGNVYLINEKSSEEEIKQELQSLIDQTNELCSKKGSN